MDIKHIKNISLVSSLTLFSRILGLLRDILLTAVFGASFLLDAFIIAFTIPNFFRKLFGEGLLSTIFTPILQKEISLNGIEQANFVASGIFSWLLRSLFTICTCSIVLLASATLFLSLGTENRTVLYLTMIMLPYAIIICLVAFIGSILHAIEHFLMPSLSPIILNIVWLCGLIWIMYSSISKETAIYFMSCVILLGGLCQLLSQIPILTKHKIRLCFTLSDSKVSLSSFWQNGVGVMMIQANALLDRIIAWTFIQQSGAVSILYIANRFIQFPLALIGISVATVSFPIFTQKVRDGDISSLQKNILYNIRIVFLLAMPATVGLWCTSYDIISFFYQNNAFSIEDSYRTAQVLRMYSLSVWIFCLQQILHKVFYALSDTKTPMKISCISVIVNVLLNLLLVHSMAEVGLALATTISSLAALLISLYQLDKKISFSFTSIIPFLSKVFLSSCCMAIFIKIIKYTEGKRGISLHILPTILVAAIIYFFCTWIFGTFKEIRNGKNRR